LIEDTCRKDFGAEVRFGDRLRYRLCG
jgi:hypothetical protein